MAGNVSSDKAALRKEAENRRRALSPEVVQRWGGEVQKHLAALPLFSDRIIRAVGVYDAQPFEVPLAEFIVELSSRGVQCVYPRVVKGTRELVFHEVGETWARGPFGIREPPSQSPRRAIDEIDVFIVPGVAFTRDGRRLGRGAGYYDSTLALRDRRAQTIGVAFDCNVVDDLPTEPHDVTIDFLATENGVIVTSVR
ncbi:MAG: 5-formyltetrahydrofolate cyclo-ligase [Archangium sp.]|nr:5-formyltetrahydrofolate cyclo-ligase [Archangium sp.]MDP3155397.1 5-formyltetrahydrofolate cyclo-ligase [Archangium sp.]MDP3573729.1 5-formyltetrahydrofolate cyclo-ligase [Archangium sp.]